MSSDYHSASAPRRQVTRSNSSIALRTGMRTKFRKLVNRVQPEIITPDASVLIFNRHSFSQAGYFTAESFPPIVLRPPSENSPRWIVSSHALHIGSLRAGTTPASGARATRSYPSFPAWATIRALQAGRINAAPKNVPPPRGCLLVGGGKSGWSGE